MAGRDVAEALRDADGVIASESSTGCRSSPDPLRHTGSNLQTLAPGASSSALINDRRARAQWFAASLSDTSAHAAAIAFAAAAAVAGLPDARARS